MDDRVGQNRRNRKTRDRSLILLFVGIALLMPPLAAIAQIDAKLGGVPVTLIYLFAVWAALIAGARLLAPSLRSEDDAPDPPDARK
ncbi:MAG: hypothetical protein AAGJ28_11350 [Pseudomonadota bacterium]